MKKTLKLKAILADRGAIKFDSGGAAVIKLEASEDQAAEVAALLVSSGKVIDCAFTFEEEADVDSGDGGE